MSPFLNSKNILVFVTLTVISESSVAKSGSVNVALLILSVATALLGWFNKLNIPQSLGYFVTVEEGKQNSAYLTCIQGRLLSLASSSMLSVSLPTFPSSSHYATTYFVRKRKFLISISAFCSDQEQVMGQKKE